MAAEQQARADDANTARGTILITGSSGLIGSRLCRAFAEDYTVAGFDIQPPPDNDAPVEFYETDLTDDESTRQSLARLKETHGSNIVAVLHLAAHCDFGESSPLYNKLTIEGTRRLLRGLREEGFSVGQFVFSSTLLVMEPDEQGRYISELSPTRSEWAYPQSKLKAEQVIHEERGDIPAVFLRIAGVYDDRCHSLPLSQHIARISEKQMESYVFPGDADHGQALIHLEDLVDCFRTVVARRNHLENEEKFLVAEPEVLSYRDLQERLGKLIHGREWPTIRIPKAVAKAGAWVQETLSGDENGPFIKPWMIDLADDHYAANISHAKVKLGWEPRHRLSEALPGMVEFLKRDPEQFYREHGLPMPEELKTE